jgi:hypothetical protein
MDDGKLQKECVWAGLSCGDVSDDDDALINYCSWFGGSHHAGKNVIGAGNE